MTEKEGDIEVTATPIKTDAVVASPPSTPSTPATTTTTTTPSPPGVEAGGIWGKQRYVGSTTGAAACVGFLCFCLPGLLILCCPLDERDAYKIKGKVYLADGQFVGNAGNVKFTATAPPAQQTIVRQ